MKECYLCGATTRLERHHINWHHNDRGKANVVILCKRCHVELHRVGYLSSKELEAIRAKVRAKAEATARAPVQLGLGV